MARAAAFHLLTRRASLLSAGAVVSILPPTWLTLSTNGQISSAMMRGHSACTRAPGGATIRSVTEQCRYLWLGHDAGYMGWKEWGISFGVTLAAVWTLLILTLCLIRAAKWLRQEGTGPTFSSGGRPFQKLWRDTSGNTLFLIAAALLPLLAMAGGAVDMSRAYLAQTRLQSACDAGVLAARKKLGSDVVASGRVSPDVAAAGNSFFNANYREGSYASSNRSFQMSLEEDYSISGEAGVVLPTAVMQVFGFRQFDLHVNCQARLNYSNTDIMMVLDTTGSMRDTNPGDSEPKIDVLRDVVRTFYRQVNGSKAPGTRIRFGFVPYSTNVNVGALLQDDWVVKNWTYQSREDSGSTTTAGTRSYYANQRKESGSYATTQHSSYPATYNAGNEISGGSYSCNTPAPANSYTQQSVLESTTTEPFVGPPAGTRTIQHYRRTTDGTVYWVSLSGATCYVYQTKYDAYVDSFDLITEPYNYVTPAWTYRPVDMDVSDWRRASNGCIEERSTYEINDYGNVDLHRALDLDLDLVPTPSDPSTQWRPMYPNVIYERSLNSGGGGSFSVAPVTTSAQYFRPQPSGYATCPSPSMPLTELNFGQVNSYVNSLTAVGSTYHDIGMIWGGRLLSPTGLFAQQNADVVGKPTSRHLIFLTDGQTETFSASYGSYGVEPLDRRRWSPGSSLSLTQTVENRFTVACNEVKKRNITVWVIAFGTDLNPVFTNCAGEGRSFHADNSAELDEVFNKIAAAMGDLRLSR